jgi:hypothetical protein
MDCEHVSRPAGVSRYSGLFWGKVVRGILRFLSFEQLGFQLLDHLVDQNEGGLQTGSFLDGARHGSGDEQDLQGGLDGFD